LPEIQIETAAEYNHDQWQCHRPQDFKYGDDEFWQVILNAGNLDNNGYKSGDKHGIQDSAPSYRPSCLLKEKLIRTEEQRGMEHDEYKELGDIRGVRTEYATQNNQRKEYPVLVKEAHVELGARVFIGYVSGNECQYQGDGCEEKPPQR